MRTLGPALAVVDVGARSRSPGDLGRRGIEGGGRSARGLQMEEESVVFSNIAVVPPTC